MHDIAAFLRQVVVFSKTGVVSWEISHANTCAIIFFRYFK